MHASSSSRPHSRFALPHGIRKRFARYVGLAQSVAVRYDPLFEGCASCRHALRPAPERLGCLLEPDFPIDVVYAWVDGSDPVLAAKRAAYLPPEARRKAASHGPALHRDNDELRYALRSLETYAPWVHRVFIVSDAQVPRWLNTAHPKIRMVDHRDFIPHEYLPTFSSRPIEAFLHRIPDLGEYYLYCNDDFFLAAPCDKALFFTPNGLPRLFADWRPSRRHGFEHPQSPHTHSFGNVCRYLRAHGIEPDPAVIVAHAPYAQTRGLAGDAYVFYEEAVHRFCRNKFRSREDMVFSSHAVPLFACAAKRAVPCDVPHYYINTKRFDHQAHYDALLRQKGTPCQPPFFCLNDVGDRKSTTWQRDMENFLQAYYPTPSSFEKSGTL